MLKAPWDKIQKVQSEEQIWFMSVRPYLFWVQYWFLSYLFHHIFLIKKQKDHSFSEQWYFKLLNFPFFFFKQKTKLPSSTVVTLQSQLELFLSPGKQVILLYENDSSQFNIGSGNNTSFYNSFFKFAILLWFKNKKNKNKERKTIWYKYIIFNKPYKTDQI